MLQFLCEFSLENRRESQEIICINWPENAVSISFLIPHFQIASKNKTHSWLWICSSLHNTGHHSSCWPAVSTGWRDSCGIWGDSSYALQEVGATEQKGNTWAGCPVTTFDPNTYLTVGFAQDGRAVRTGSEPVLFLPNKVCWWLGLCFCCCCPHLWESSLLLTSATGVPLRSIDVTPLLIFLNR